MQPVPRPESSLLRGVEHLVLALAMVAVATAAGMVIAPRWGVGPVDMIYLPAVLAAAALWGLGTGVVAAMAAAIAYNFFFTAPVHTLRINRVADIVTVVVLLVVALVTSQLAAGIRRQAQVAAGHAARNATIAGLAGHLLSSSSEAEIATVACAELHSLFRCNAMLVRGLPRPEPIAAVPEGNRLTPSDIAAAALTLETGEPAGRGTSRSQPAEWVFYPVRSNEETLAAAALARDDGAAPALDEQLPLLTNLLDQVALALERARLEREAREFTTTRSRDRIRSALLASIGNDLEPPLAAMAEAAREQRRTGRSDREFVATIESEAKKLRRYVGNLTDLGPADEQRPVEASGVSIDLFNRLVRRDGEDVHLTPKEFAVLAELARQPGRVLGHAHLLKAVWGPAQEGQTEYLRVAVRSLRQKLEHDPAHPRLILNEPAVGYRLATS